MSAEDGVGPEVREQVRRVYEQADREVAAAGPACAASGRCCRFKEYGHTLFLSRFEADVLLAGAPAYDKPVSADFCPFQVGGLCTAREARPLGCRIYFCAPDYQETGNAITERALGRLKALARRHGLPWEYAPLHYFLNNAPGRAAPAEPAAAGSAGRVPLPLVPGTDA